MTYTAESPAVKRAEHTYLHHASGGHRERLAAVLTEHKRGLQARLRTTEAANAQLRDQCDTLRTELDASVQPQAPVTLREITDDDARACYEAFIDSVPWASTNDSHHSNWRNVARALRDRLADSLPRWQPIEPGDIKPGMLVRGTDCGYLVEGTVTEVASSWITTSNESWITAGRTWEVDPRTIPAEPEPADPEPADPDWDLVSSMAEAIRALGDAFATDYARAALTAYRAHVDGDQS